MVQDPHAAPADRQLFLDGWFDTQMPDMNQRNPLVARYLIQNTLGGSRYATWPVYAKTLTPMQTPSSSSAGAMRCWMSTSA